MRFRIWAVILDFIFERRPPGAIVSSRDHVLALAMN